MKILVTNDDGVRSRRLEMLVKVLSHYGFVYVAAPKVEKSASSHAITISNKIELFHDYHVPNSEKTVAVDGWPADATRVGLKVFDVDFDLVVTGLNYGYNIASDVIYSGTTAAAREATILGVHAIAVSAPPSDEQEIDIEENLREVFEHLIGDKVYEKHPLFNVNLPKGRAKGYKYTTQGRRLLHAEFSKIDDTDTYKITYSHMNYDEKKESDVVCLSNGYTSITPLEIDQTDYNFKQ